MLGHLWQYRTRDWNVPLVALLCYAAAQMSAQQQPAVLLPNRAEAYQHVLGENDQVTIHSQQVVELADKAYRVESDGNVNFPLVGKVPASGLSVRELEASLTKRLKEFYLDPQVSVAVTEFRSEPVSVIGAVGTPGVHQLQGRRTLLEMLSSAGGIRGDAGPILTITRHIARGGVPLPNAHLDETGKYSVAELRIKDLLSARDPSQNILLCPNDVLTIPEAETIYVVGEVRKAGKYTLGTRPTLSVLEALSMAEGLGPRASPKHSYILRAAGSDGSRQEIAVNLSSIIAGKAKDIPLQPNDILLIPDSAMKGAALKSLEMALQIGTGVALWRR